MSEPDSIYRPTATEIKFAQLPKLVISKVEEEMWDFIVTGVRKWGEEPNHYFVIEFDSHDTRAYNPNGAKIRPRVPGRVL